MFLGNIRKHLMAGLAGFLFGALAKGGIEAPSDFSLKSILKLILQLIGITPEAVRKQLVKRLGEKNVARLEKALDLISKLLGGGIGGLVTSLAAYVGSLKSMVINAIMGWAIVQIVKKAIIKVISMFSPLSGLISIIETIFRVIEFLVTRAAQIGALFKGVVDTIVPLAKGETEQSAKRIEQALGLFVPVAMGFLAGLIGLGNIAGAAVKILKKVGKWVKKQIDKVINFIVKKVRKPPAKRASCAAAGIASLPRRTKTSRCGRAPRKSCCLA